MELSRGAGTGFSGRGAGLAGRGGEELGEVEEVEVAEICVWWAPVEGGPRGVATGDPVQGESYVFHCHHHLCLTIIIICLIIIIICVTVGVPNCIVTYRVEFGRRKVPVTKMTVAIIKVCKSKCLRKG